MVCQIGADDQTVSGWTGFNIQVRNEIPVTQDTVSYLPTINAPATQMFAVHDILTQSVKIMQALHLEEIVVVMDQAHCAKAAEIAWKHRDRFDYNSETWCIPHNVLLTCNKWQQIPRCWTGRLMN